jgi:hypothetical protein
MNYNDPRNSSTTRKAFALAAGTPLSYDVGYKKDLGKARLDEWIKRKGFEKQTFNREAELLYLRNH